MMDINFKANQAAQYDFLADMAPGETLFQGGLGSGKSYVGSRKVILLTARNGCDSLAVAPTYGDLFRFVVPALKDAAADFKLPVIDHSAKPERPGLYLGPWFIHTMTAEKPQRFAGFEVGAIWIDEGARIRQSADNPLLDAPTQIRSRLRHPAAQSLHMLVTTTPEGLDTWVHRDFFADVSPMRRSYIGSTDKNEHLPEEYLQSLRESLPPELLDQYMYGKAVSYVANRAHASFSIENIDDSIGDINLPAHLGADYNVAPMCWVLCQHVGDELHVVDECVIEDNATVDAAMYQCDEQGWGNYPVIKLHVDKSAKNRATTGDPEFTVMKTEAQALGWNVLGTAFGVNPPINARINLLSRLIRSATGVRTVKVHPRCKRLIEDMEQTGRGSNGYDPGKMGKRGHILDALGYVAWDLMGGNKGTKAAPKTGLSI